MNKHTSKKISFSLQSRMILMIYTLTLATGFFCAWQSIKTAHGKIMENAYKTAINEQFRTGYTIKKMTENNNYTKDEESLYLLGAIRSSAASYYEYYASDASFRIKSDDGTIYESIPGELMLYLKEPIKKDGTVTYFLRQCDGNTFIFVSSYIKIYQQLFRVDYIQDITSINHLLADLSRKITTTLFLTEMLLFFILNFIIRKGLEPLDALQKLALKIAEGNYGERAKVIHNDEVGQLALSVNQMTDAIQDNIHALRETARSKEMLASNLAHEIKTPVTSIVAYSDYAAKKEIKGEELHGILEYIRKEGQRVGELSDKILKWNALSHHNEIDIRPCRPGRIIEQALFTLRPVAESKNQEISVVNNVSVVYADETLIVSLIINLCKNALNASGEGSRIRLFIYNNDDENIVIKVEDCGSGIEKDELEKITEPFYMVDKARDRSKVGSGLGLSLCLSIVRAHNGKLEIESVFGEGTCVTVIIPQKENHLQIHDISRTT